MRVRFFVKLAIICFPGLRYYCCTGAGSRVPPAHPPEFPVPDTVLPAPCRAAELRQQRRLEEGSSVAAAAGGGKRFGISASISSSHSFWPRNIGVFSPSPTVLGNQVALFTTVMTETPRTELTQQWVVTASDPRSVPKRHRRRSESDRAAASLAWNGTPPPGGGAAGAPADRVDEHYGGAIRQVSAAEAGPAWQRAVLCSTPASVMR